MDVHYLPSNHTSKPASEYIVDFIFIFLAVTLGLFVNNLRELYIENEKSNVYAQSLYNDLKADTALIQKTIVEKAWIEDKFDSVETILATKNLGEYNEIIYYADRYLTINSTFISQDKTFQLLLNSGISKYMKDIDLYKKTANYYALYNQYKIIESNAGSNENNELTVIESNLFNPRDLTAIDNYKSLDFYTRAILSEQRLKPIRRDYNYLKLFYLKVDNAKKLTYTSKEFLKRLKVSASEIMKDLQEEYDLK